MTSATPPTAAITREPPTPRTTPQQKQHLPVGVTVCTCVPWSHLLRFYSTPFDIYLDTPAVVTQEEGKKHKKTKSPAYTRAVLAFTLQSFPLLIRILLTPSERFEPATYRPKKALRGYQLDHPAAAVA